MNVTFVWGQGGVGKSHVVLRSACLAEGPTLLVTTDPSLRVLELVAMKGSDEQKIKLGEAEFTVKATQANRLFEILVEGKQPHPRIKGLFDQMVKGLQEFRNYITLLELSYELKQKKYKNIIVDTPPFSEAVSLYSAVFNLQHFFGTSLAQLALKTANVGWVHTTMKKIFEATQLFIGKKASKRIFEFIDWIVQHTEKFQIAALYLEKLFSEESTKHRIVVTPDTAPVFLKEAKTFFKELGYVDFVLNRSTKHFSLPEQDDPFIKEMVLLQSKEKLLENEIQKEFSNVEIERIPMMLMGEDTKEELEKFVEVRV